MTDFQKSLRVEDLGAEKEYTEKWTFMRVCEGLITKLQKAHFDVRAE
jgi:hypothetical protein